MVGTYIIVNVYIISINIYVGQCYGITIKMLRFVGNLYGGCTSKECFAVFDKLRLLRVFFINICYSPAEHVKTGNYEIISDKVFFISIKKN